MEGQHRRRGHQEHHAQVESDEEHQHFGTHQVHPGGQLGGIGVAAGILQTAHRRQESVLPLLSVPGIVGQEVPAGHRQLLCFLGHHLDTPVLHKSVGLFLPPGSRIGIIVRLEQIGAPVLILIHREGDPAAALLLRVKALRRQQCGQIHGPPILLRPDRQFHILGHGLVRHLRDGVVQSYRGGGDADGQQQHEADHRHGPVGGIDIGVELPQDEQIQIFIIELLAGLAQTQQETGQSPEEQQGTQAAQPDHYPEQFVHPQQAPGQQHGVGHGQQNAAHEKEHHRDAQAAHLQFLIDPPGPQQVDELPPGYGKCVVEHHQQEDGRKGQHRLADSRERDGKGKVGHGHRKQPRGKEGQGLGEHHTQRQPHRQRRQSNDGGLCQQQPGHLPALHAKHQVGAQLPGPAADQKTGGVQDEEGQYHPHKNRQDADELLNSSHNVGPGVLGQIADHTLGLQSVEHIKQAHAEGHGQEVHPVVPEAAPYILDSQLREHRSGHLPAQSPRR